MQPSKLEQLIYSMLTENTGAHLLDSGGAYGRHWERNQKKTLTDFKAEPSVTFDLEPPFTLNPSVSTFHYLTSGVLELDALCDEFNTLPCKDWDGDAYGISTEQTEWIKAHGLSIGETWNTYNGENLLDQVLQGANVNKTENESQHEFPDYVLLQIHGGCDVRGGYTDAKLFKVADGEYLNPCPDLSLEIDGKPYEFYGGSDLIESETGKSIDNSVEIIKPDSKVSGHLINE